MVFLEAGVDPSGARRVRRFGVVESRPVRSSDHETTCAVTEASTRKVRLSPLCLAIPTILPKRSWDSDGNDVLTLVDL
jgi:hypothetical protein